MTFLAQKWGRGPCRTAFPGRRSLDGLERPSYSSSAGSSAQCSGVHCTRPRKVLLSRRPLPTIALLLTIPPSHPVLWGVQSMTLSRWLVLSAALAVLTWTGGPLRAGDIYADKEPAKLEPLVLPKPGDVQKFTVHPDKIALKSADDAAQLLLTAELAGGRLQDLTGDVKYDVADATIVRVTSAGR